MTDDALLAALRLGSAVVAMDLRHQAADRIEEYCREAAVAEEALLRVYMAAGGTIEELPDESVLDHMVARVTKALGAQSGGGHSEAAPPEIVQALCEADPRPVVRCRECGKTLRALPLEGGAR